MSLTSFLRQIITIKNPTGARDVHGKPTLGTSTSVKCRFERTYKTIVTEQREKEPIHAIAFVGPAATVEIGAECTYGSDKYRVLVRSDIVGRRGQLHHYELMLQLWSYA